MDKRNIYLDHAATTSTAPEVLEAMLPYFTADFGNANSIHAYGRECAGAVDAARASIAAQLNAKPVNVYFTSGGSESDNWAIRGAAKANRDKGNHIITSVVEHPAVYETCRELEKDGFEVTYLPVDEQGFVSVEALENAIKDTTILVSIMYANNEIGTIMPIKELAKVAKAHKVLFHTDAVQAVGSVPIDVVDLGVDMLSMSAHKFYGPKGIGALYVKTGTRLARLIYGGEQERGKRAGTTNTPGIVGMAKALELANASLVETSARLRTIRDKFVSEVENNIEYVKYNGARDSLKRLPGNANFSFKYIEGESLLFSLDMDGIATSSGSACAAMALEPSRTLLSIGVPIELAHGSIRFSFGKENTIEDVAYVVDCLKKIVKRLRDMSPMKPKA